MKKHFLLLLLLTLLPLAGWAYDYEVDVEVKPYNASVVWSGVKPSGVEASWIGAPGSSLTTTVKTAIAEQLEINDLADYNAGIHDYYLQLKSAAVGYVDNGDTRYNIRLNNANTAQLTITKFTEAPVFTTTDLAFVGGDLVYTGEAQALLSGGATATANGFTVPVVYTTKATPAETDWVALADLKETNANTTGYTVYYKVVGTDNYAGSGIKTMAGTKAIAQANTAAFNVEAVTGLVFNNTDQALVTKTDAEAPIVPFGAEGLQYKIDDGDWTAFTTLDAITGKSAKNAVAYAVKFKIPADASANANWADIESGAINVTIAKATPAFISWPTTANQGLATGLKYNETAQTLALTQAVAKITPAVGDAFEVPVKYELRRSFSDGTSGQTSWSTKSFDNLKGTYAGQYWIRYSVVATDDYNGLTAGNAKSGNTIIAKATIPAESYTAPTAKEGLRTTGAAQELITDGVLSDTKYGEFQYSLTNNGTDWSTETPTGTDAGNYTVYYRIYPPVTSNAQNYDIVSGNVAVTIAAKSKVTITIPANQSFGYGTTPTLEYTATWEAKGSDVLKEEGLTWTWYTGATGDTQASKVGGYYPAGEYYVMVGGLAVDGTTAASQEIVYPTDRQKVKITAGQVTAKISGTATYGSLPEFTLTHVSGLSPAEAENFNAGNNLTKVTIKQNGEVVNNLENVAPDNAGLAALAKGEYDLEATASCGTNYAVVVTGEKLTVGAKSIAGAVIDVTTDADVIVYNNKAWGTVNPIAFEVTETSGIEAADYDVTYSNNVNAGTATITLTGKRNYTGTVTKDFTIKKAALTIKANDKTWKYGTTEPTYAVTVEGQAEGETALEVGETLAGIDGALTVVRTSNKTVGMHAGALVAKFGSAQPVESDNYTITYSAGNLQIVEGAITIKLKNNVITGTYGNAPSAAITAEILTNKANYELDNSVENNELPDGNLADILDVSGVTFAIDPIENNKYEVNDAGYKFTMTGAATTNYAVTISNGTYKVNPADITLYAKDQAINWADEDNTNDEANTTVSGATVEIAAGALKCGDALTAVVASIVIESQKVGTNNISLTAADNANYNITVNSDGTNAKYGVLTVTGAPAITLSTADPDLAGKLASYDGKSMPVKIDFTARNARGVNWKADTWVTMTLPFNISVADLSKALGYAIVNVIDPSRTEIDGTGSKFYGKLTMKGGNGDGTEDYLVANKPFLVKIADDIANVTGGVIDFGTQTIVAPASDLTVDAGHGAKFIGTYATRNVTPDDNKAIWFLIGSNNQWLFIGNNGSWDVLPFEGYIDMSNASAPAPNMTFYFEELDGSTTAIKGISTDELNGKMAEGMYNMNGMKLNTVPTQKGVYIMNGKKVVIK